MPPNKRLSCMPPKVAKSASSAKKEDAPVEKKKDLFVIEAYDPNAYFEPNPKHLDGVQDMSALIYLEGPNILHNLDVRYGKDEVYTSISKVLIAINPYKTLGCYSPELIMQYRELATRRNTGLPAHVFSISQSAYYQMVKFGKNQSMIVCGESGSGKTESAKHLMRYLAYSPNLEGGDGKPSIEKQVLDVNPILESIGNAKTLLNNNSSRFGKFTKLIFKQDFSCVLGSIIETYLLEKSRVCRQDPGERNFHIFYLTCSNTFPAEWKSEFGLKAAEHYYYINQGGCFAVDGMDDGEWFTEMNQALLTLGFDRTKDIFSLIAGILHLGNISFVENSAGNAMLSESSGEEAKLAAKCFEVKASQLIERLTSATLSDASSKSNSSIRLNLTVEKAEINRDAVAKALFNGLFTWVVDCINARLFDEKSRDPALKWVGILDVFGFENFANNSFEQFCINFANERLQAFFNQAVINSEQIEYKQEAIQWVELDIPDNEETIKVVTTKQTGLVGILDSSCRMASSDAEKFIDGLFKMYPYHRSLKKVVQIKGKNGQNVKFTGFSIRHYAGVVIYNAHDFRAKNSDNKEEETLTLFASSQLEVVREVLKERIPDEITGPSVKPSQAVETSSRSGAKSTMASRGTTVEAKTSFRSVGTYFLGQLDSLLKTLGETTPHFVRCIKPNSVKKPGRFDKNYIYPQLQCGGVIEALRILKLGFPTRAFYADIFDRYSPIINTGNNATMNKRDFCEAILRCVPPTLDREQFQLGLTKVFFRPGKQEFMEKLLTDTSCMTPEVVDRIKTFLVNKRFTRARSTVMVVSAFAKRLANMRALKRVKKVFKASKFIAVNMVERLKIIRKENAAKALQAQIRAWQAQRLLALKQRAVLRLGKVWTNTVTRKVIVSSLVPKIAASRERRLAEKKRIEEEERTRKAEEARLKREQEAAERAERQRQAAAEAAEKKRQAEEAARLAAEERKRQEEERARIAADEEAKRRREREEREERERIERERREKEHADRMEKERLERLEHERLQRIAREEEERVRREKEEHERRIRLEREEAERQRLLKEEFDRRERLRLEDEERTRLANERLEAMRRQQEEYERKERERRDEMERQDRRRMEELERQAALQREELARVSEEKRKDMLAEAKRKEEELQASLARQKAEREAENEKLFAERQAMLKRMEEAKKAELEKLEAEKRAALEREEAERKAALIKAENDRIAALRAEDEERVRRQRWEEEERKRKLLWEDEERERQRTAAAHEAAAAHSKMLVDLQLYEESQKKQVDAANAKLRADYEAQIAAMKEELAAKREAAVQAAEAKRERLQTQLDEERSKLRTELAERETKFLADMKEKRDAFNEELATLKAAAIEKQKQADEQRRQQEIFNAQLQERENELIEKEEKIVEAEVQNAALKAQMLENEKDNIALRLTGGGEGLLVVLGSESKPIRIQCNEDGLFTWSDLKTGENPDNMALSDVREIGEGESASSTSETHDNHARRLYLKTPDEQVAFEFGNIRLRNDWLLSLRYAVRNLRELGMLSRPTGDPARGNALAARLADQVQMLKQQDEITKKQLKDQQRSLREHIEMLEAVIKQKDGEILDFKGKVERLELTLANRAALEDDRMKAAMERMKNSEERDGAIKDQYAQMTATIRADADKKVAELREQIAQIKQERAESVAEAKVLRDDAQRLNLEKGQLSTQLMTAEANLERVRSEKKDRAEQYRDLSSRFDKLAADKRDLDYKHERLHDDKISLRAQLDEAGLKIRQHEEKERKNLLDEMDRLRAAQSRPQVAEVSPELLTELSALRKSNQEKDMAAHTLEFENQKLTRAKSYLDEELKTLQQRLSHANEEIVRLKDDIQAAESKARRDSRQNAKAVVGNPAADAKLREEKEKNKKLEEQLKSVQKEERTAAIQAAAKMMTSERKKTAKLIQVSRNLKKKSQDLENTNKQFIQIGEGMSRRSKSVRALITDEKKKSQFDAEMVRLDQFIADAKTVLEAKAAPEQGVDIERKKLERQIEAEEKELNILKDVNTRGLQKVKDHLDRFNSLKLQLTDKGLDIANLPSVDNIDPKTKELLKLLKAEKLSHAKAKNEAEETYKKVMSVSEEIKKLKEKLDGLGEAGGEAGEDVDAEPPLLDNEATPPPLPVNVVSANGEECVVM